MRPFPCVFLCMATIFAIALAGCTTATEKQTAATAPDDEPYRFETEGQVPPPEEGSMRREVDRVDVFEETPVAEGAFAVEAVEAEAEPIAEDIAVDSLTMKGAGFRVQVFATGDRHRAEQYRTQAETRLNVTAYVEHVDDIYKVRVGDCRSREEAERLRLKCQAKGYKDAWIVSSEVRFPKATPETPVPEKE